MMKYLSSSITFSEFPDEIALCVNVTGCTCMCDQCSEPELRPDTGIELTCEEVDRLINENPGISLFGFMGGDSDHDQVKKLADYIHGRYPDLLVGMYSGRDYLDMKLLESLNVYKIGRWLMPKGDVSTWYKTNCGPLKFPFSNQLYFEKHDGLWVNATYKFRKEVINNLEREIIK